MQDLACNARTVLVMTGTLYGGRASSLFYLLYRTLPAFRLLYGYDEVGKFIDDYGLRERVTKAQRLDRWHSTYGYVRKSTRTKELPGAHPGMVSLLLPNFAFLNLSDLGVELPPYTEERFPVEMSDGLADGYEAIRTLGEEAVRLARKGDMSFLSAYLQCALGWVDCPDEETFELPDKTIRVPEVSPDEDGMYPKDRAFLRLVQSELAQGRRVGVYFTQVRKRDPMPRVQKILQKHGIDARILRQSVKPAEREKWYRDAIKSGMQVLLCNGNLVGLGLDLIELKTLVEYQIEYSLYALRQRDRRSWRLGQDEPVRVIFMYYQETMQEQALRLIAKKLRAACMRDGELAAGLAAFDSHELDLRAELMKVVMGELEPRDWEIGAIEISSVPARQSAESEARVVEPIEPDKCQQLRLF